MTFKALVKSKFEECKKISGNASIKIPVLDSNGKWLATLVPITRFFREEMPEISQLMSTWRVENPTISTGNFEVTVERTEKWLDNLVINRDDRLIFMLVDQVGNYIGHLGFTHANYESETIDLDSVLRGVKSGYPGIMTMATKSMMSWGFKNLKPNNIELEVYSDNDSAVRFYDRMGFKIKFKKPLMKVILEDEEKYELAPDDYVGPVEKHFLCMEYKGEALKC